MSLAEEFGRILTTTREAAGKSRRALAAEAGLADTSLLAVEHGRANPTLGRMEELAELYGVEVAVIAVTGPAANTGRRIVRAH